MAFPSNPSINDTYNIGDKSYVWNGNAWARTVLTDADNILSSYALDADLTTANTIEHTNLYYTNARVYANVINIGYATNTYVNTRLLTKANVADLTTANVAEGSNLYFTNARVLSYLQDVGGNIIPAGDLQYNLGSPSRRWKDLYLSGNTVYLGDALIEATDSSVVLPPGSAISGQTSDNIAEGNVNVYFSNTRVRAALSADTGVSFNSSTGAISIGQNVSPTRDVTFANVTVTGNLLVQGNAVEFAANTLVINDPLIQVGKTPVGDVVDLGFFGHYIGGSPSVERHAGLFRDATDGQFKLFTNLDPEPATIVDTANASYQAANLVVNFVVGKVTDISNHTTSSLTEGSNLYFTNTRAVGALTAGSGIGIAANGLITSSGAVTSVAGQVGAISNAQLACAAITSGVLNTANVAEGANLYFTNTRAISALTAGTNISIAANGRVTGTATGSGVSWQSVQTSNFAAVADRAYPVNTTSSAIAVTLPASPSNGQQIVLSDYAGTFGTNSLTVYPNGNKINGNTGNVFATANRVSINLVYLDSTQGWIVSYGWGGTGLVGALTADYLVVAGGGGSSSVTAGAGGGGGGGGVLTSSGLALTLNVAYNLAVGGGGAGGGSNGSNSSFTGPGLSVTAVGGGGSSGLNGASGGSGGGGSASYPNYGTGGAGTAGQGNAGGSSGVQLCGGGGGGAAAAGPGDGNSGGNGGAGLLSTITGASVYYAGGGGGGGCNGRAVGTGGAGGGGAAGAPGNNAGTAGSTNTGGGGGGPTILGGGYSAPGVAGGSGIIILKIPNTHSATFSVGLTTSLSTSQTGYKTYSITAGTGTVTFSLA